jgi:hypothetical protein
MDTCYRRCRLLSWFWWSRSVFWLCLREPNTTIEFSGRVPKHAQRTRIVRVRVLRSSLPPEIRSPLPSLIGIGSHTDSHPSTRPRVRATLPQHIRFVVTLMSGHRKPGRRSSAPASAARAALAQAQSQSEFGDSPTRRSTSGLSVAPATPP